MAIFCHLPKVENFFWVIPLRLGSIIIALIGISSTVLELIIGAIIFDFSSVDIFFIMWIILDVVLSIGAAIFLCGLWCCESKARLTTQVFLWIILLVMITGLVYMVVSIVHDAMEFGTFAYLDFILHIVSSSVWFYFMVVLYSFMEDELEDDD